MHLYVTVHNGMTEAELVESALRQGAMVYGTERMRFPGSPSGSNVMIGFSAIEFDAIGPGVAALKCGQAAPALTSLAHSMVLPLCYDSAV